MNTLQKTKFLGLTRSLTNSLDYLYGNNNKRDLNIIKSDIQIASKNLNRLIITLISESDIN